MPPLRSCGRTRRDDRCRTEGGRRRRERWPRHAYWQIGYRVRTEVLEGRRAEYLQREGPRAAIRREIECFLLKLGGAFAFVERQKRITLDADGYYLDLLFSHRRVSGLEKRLHRAIQVARNRLVLEAEVEHGYRRRHTGSTRQGEVGRGP